MKKRNNIKRLGIDRQSGHLRQSHLINNIVKIDRFDENYIVVPSITDRRSIQNNRVIKFVLGDATKEKEVEKLLKRNHARGGITYATQRVKINKDDEGVWPPFIPKNIKIVEVEGINSIDIKKKGI